MKMHSKKTFCSLRTVILTVCLAIVLTIAAGAASEINVTVSSPTGTYASESTMYIDPEITVSSTGNLTGGTVNINGFVSGDNLGFTNANGITGSYSSSKGILTISGNASADAYQTFLRSITFYSTSTSGSRTFEIILSNTGSSTLYCSDTGHFYQYIGTNTNWNTAKNNSANMTYTYNGVTYNGYLATITSAAENAFITDKLGSDAWIGASDASSENTWLWVTGPESGTEFFYGNGGSGSTHTYTYANWNSGEPNNSGTENYAEIYCSSSTPGKWNDLNGTQSLGYVVEYGNSYIGLGSSGSATKTITIATVTPPGAPAIGTAAAGDGQATVSFSAPASNGGAAIIGYTVTSSPGGITATGSSSPITVTGLTNGTAYTFTVTATNSAGTGSASSASNSVTPKSSQVITFANPGSQTFGTAPTLTATASSGLTVTFTSETPDVCSITVDGSLTFLKAGTATITAHQAGDGMYFAAADVSRSFTVNAVVPGAPAIGTAAAGDGQATVSFTAPASNGGAAITGYTVTSNPGGITATGSSSPITVTGLTNGTEYTFTVTATNSAGTGSASSASNSVTPKSSQAITFSNPGSQTFGTAPTLTAAASSGLTVTFTSETPDVCSITVDGSLTFLKTGTATITAHQAGDGMYFAAADVSRSFTVNAVVPGAPAIGTAAAGDGQATVSFTAPASNGGAAITGYTVISNPGGITATGSSSPITVTGLTNGTEYTFTVTATNSAGTGSASSASSSVTPATVPGAPAIGVVTAGDGQVTVSFTAPSSNGGAAITGYTVISNPGGITATGSSSPIIVTGLTNETPYTFTVTATNNAGTGSASAASAAITPYSPPADDTPSPNPSNSAQIIVNGEAQNAGTLQTTVENWQTTTTVTVNYQKLQQILDEKGENATVVIPVTTGSNVAVGVLNGQMVKDMETSEATLVFQTNTATYTLPASEINIDSISQQLGQNVSLSDISIKVKIAEPPADTVKVVESAAQAGEFSIVVPPVDFTVSCTYDNQTVNVSSFSAYVERLIAIPDGVVPSKITTGIVVEPDGTTHHVPTKVTEINGKYYAVINSLTNSTYAVIQHPIEFVDVANHWAKDAVNNMGSRMIVNGVDANNYEPDRDITRAEFAAIVVRALGLEPETAENPFSDVMASDWYSGYIKTAFSYGIITGYDTGTFGPNDKITREQAIAMIARAMKITGLKISLTDSEISALLSSYSDADNTSDYAKNSIAECLKTGIITGTDGGVIAPQDYITRAEVAVIVERLLQKSNLI